jgi:hypothetical protein
MAGREHRISSYIIGFSHYLVKGLDRNITLFKHGGNQLRSNEVDKIHAVSLLLLVMTLGVSRFGAATLKSEFGIRPSLSIFIDSSIDVAGQPTGLH